MFSELKNKLKEFSKLLAVVLLALCISVPAFAEEESSANATTEGAQAPRVSRLARFKAAARARLLKKLTNKDGASSKIILLPPVDNTNLQQPGFTIDSIKKSIQVYDPKIQVEYKDYKMESLTLEHFRKAMIKNQADVLLTLVMHPTNFDIYLYDARTPYQIYAHSEPISSGAQYELNKEAAQYYIKILVRRTLYRFIKNQYYELPREESPTILQAEIPRHIASQESLEKINREAYSKWYVTGGLGVALSSGASKSRWWNANLISLSLGRKLVQDFYLELNADFSAYDLFGGFVRYILVDKQKIFKMTVGLGGGYLIDRQTFNWDINDDISRKTIMGGASSSILLPVGDIYFKAEGRLYMGLNKTAMIFQVLPGLLFVF